MKDAEKERERDRESEERGGGGGYKNTISHRALTCSAEQNPS